jgi:hypothetical protein
MRTGWLARLIRGLGLGYSPLRRHTDRIQSWIMIGLIAVFLIAVPVSWFTVGQWIQKGGLREQRAQRSWHPEPAVVVHGVHELPPTVVRLPLGATAQVLARWPGAGGRPETGLISVPVTQSATGTSIQVWVNHAGRVTGPPLVTSALAKRVRGVQVLAQVILVMLLTGVAVLTRWWLNRLRMARWEEEWASIGPRWSRRL